MNKIIFLHLDEIDKYRMLKNLHLVSLSMSNIFEIDVAIVISPVLHINFAKIHKDSKVVLSMNLSFDRMLSLVKRFL